MSELAVRMLPGPMREFPPARATAGRFGSTLVQLRYRVRASKAPQRPAAR